MRTSNLAIRQPGNLVMEVAFGVRQLLDPSTRISTPLMDNRPFFLCWPNGVNFWANFVDSVN